MCPVKILIKPSFIKKNRPLIEHFIIAGENIFEFSKDPALVSELTKNAQESKTIYLEHQEELER